jgi:response regulator RpfG family c-di-GMP phosphodiesterase
MATILVVDDHLPSREFLVTLLGYAGHRLLEAGDGAEALRRARAERPDLVISDILMPTMDGFEFVRQLRADPAVAGTAVIFYTATYHRLQARGLADACGVVHLLTKPARPEAILHAVSVALNLTAPPAPRPAEDFRREHLALLTDTLSHKVTELEAANLRLAALADENARLLAETQRRLEHLAALRAIDLAILSSSDLGVTLQVVLEQTTDRLGTDAAAVLLLDPATQTLAFAAGRGFRSRAAEQPPLPAGECLAGAVVAQRRLISVPDLSERGQPGWRVRPPAAEAFRAYHAVPLIAKGQVKGVLETFHRTLTVPTAEWLEFLETLAGQAAIAIDNAEMVQGLKRSHAELCLAYDATLEGWVRALDLRDKGTEGHTQRVTETTIRLARAMGLSDEELIHMRRGALLHDIGKIGIPDRILLKPGPLTEDEWEVMRRHPLYAHQMLAPIPYLRGALDIPYCHHEKWDGTGYPRGLEGEQIPRAARIFAVADVWDALTCDRPYRAAWPREKAHAYIRAQAGKHFDPEVVRAFAGLDEVIPLRKEGQEWPKS